MGEVLRPREGERLRPVARIAPELPAITPERQPLVAPDTHHAQPCRTGFAGVGEDPLSKSRRHCRRLCSVGTQELPRPNRLSGDGNGPSVADRGAFSPPAQGASLLGSNGRITEQRPAGLDRRHRVASSDRTNPGITRQKPTERRLRLTRSNCGRDYQDLVKRGRSGALSTNLSLAQHAPVRLVTGQNGAAAPLTEPSEQRTRQRPASGRDPGSSPPTTSKSSSSRSLTVSRSSPTVRCTVSMSRPKASST